MTATGTRPAGVERVYTVGGMTCGSCAARVQRVLARQAGVADAQVNFATGQASVRVDPAVGDQTLATAVVRIGYQLAAATAGAPADGDRDTEQRGWAWRTGGTSASCGT